MNMCMVWILQVNVITFILTAEDGMQSPPSCKGHTKKQEAQGGAGAFSGQQEVGDISSTQHDRRWNSRDTQ